MESNHDHGHESLMAGPETAQNFLNRFFIVSVLLIPLALFSNFGVNFLGTPDFSFRKFVELGIATVVFYFGLVFFKHARHEIKTRQYGMMTLVSLGVGTGYLFSAVSTFVPALEVEFYLEISTLVWVLLFGHFLEARSSSAAGDALQEVAKLLPSKAHLKTEKGVEDVDPNFLNVEDIVIVKPGEKVPADGKIIKGNSNFNEAHLTGESKPVEKAKGDKVIAGAISVDGSVEVKLTKVGESSTIGQIKKLITQAEQTKPSAQRLADQAAKWLTFSALGVSILTLFTWSVIIGRPLVFAITLAITVLVIACPHALGLAIPTVSTIATRLAVKNGLFIKDMAKIEVIKNADYVVLDKTGTLTKGEFGVTSVNSFSIDRRKLLQLAGSIESHSSHVIGQAIVDYVQDKGIDLEEVANIKNLPGRGIAGDVFNKRYFLGNKKLMQEKNTWNEQAEKAFSKLSDQGKTQVYIADEKSVLGVIGLNDQVKDGAKQAVDQFHQLGIRVAMITGDAHQVADLVANRLGIDQAFAEVLPEEKYKYIRQLQNKGNVVIMAGDGVNDAPALTQADVGVAIGAGTDIAVEAGDVVLTRSDPQDVARLIVLSQKVYSKMVQNLWWALGYNIIAIPAAAGLFIPLGFRLTPTIGALLMSLSSVIVVINAMSLKQVGLLEGGENNGRKSFA